MKKVITYLCLSVLIIGCGKTNKLEEPKDLISKDKMVNILIDLSLVSSAKGINKKIIENNGIVPDEYIYKKHAIDSTQFAVSNAFYAQNIDDYKSILNRVSDSLERLKIKYNRLVETEKKSIDKAKAETVKKGRPKRDSIRNRIKDTLKPREPRGIIK